MAWWMAHHLFEVAYGGKKLLHNPGSFNAQIGRFCFYSPIGNALHLASFVGSLYDCSWTRVRMSMLPAATSRLRSWQPWKATTQPFLSFS